MNRRSFLGVLASVVAAPLLPAPEPAPSLQFHPDAFKMVDPSTGVSMRLIQNFDRHCRMDVIYGWSAIGRPNQACRVLS